jgi:nucleoside-diphosphate-sugar epimerase
MQSLKPYILLTGATGYLGKHILWQLLQHGHRVGVIVRSKKECPRKRVTEALKPFGLFPEGLLDVIEGDLTRPDCGIDPTILENLAKTNVFALIHSAGLTRFDEHLADEIVLNNLQGTKHIYALAMRMGIESFHYLSTAYVVGDSCKVFRRTNLDVGQKFNNPYEASKFEAEKYLYDTSLSDAIRVVIYRPSIVVGGFPLGENNVVSTVYTFLKASHFIRECCRRDLSRGRGIFARCGVRQENDAMLIPLRIAANPDISINMVSVESVVERIIKELRTVNNKYAVIPLLGNDFSLGALHDAFCNALAIKGISFVENSSFEHTPRTVVEENFFRATSSYQPYLIAAPSFAEEDKDQSVSIDIERIAIEFSDLLDIKVSEKQRGGLNRLALNTLGVTGPQDYFHRFVNGQLGKSFLKRISYVDTKIRFLIRGDQVFDQVIHFDKGNIHYDHETDFDCSYELTQLLFNEIVNGRIDLKRAFFDGKVNIKGNRETALKFGFLFSEHFQNIDDRIIEEVAEQ